MKHRPSGHAGNLGVGACRDFRKRHPWHPVLECRLRYRYLTERPFT